MNKDTMAYIMKCVIILHNMCVEERKEINEPFDVEDEAVEETMVGGSVPPMWAGLVRMGNEQIIRATPGSIAAMCEARNFMDEKKEHELTKKLIIEHVWDKHGEE